MWLVPHLSSFTIFSECFWVLYVSTSCLPRMFSSIDSSKRESVCGKAWWYGRDVPKVKILFHSRRPTISFGKDHRWSLQIFCCNYVPMSCLPRMFSSINSLERESVQICRSGWASSNAAGKICPLVLIGLTELPNSGWAKAHPARPLAASLQCTCGKARWYGRDVPKVKILLHSRRPTISFGKDHRWSLQIFCCNYVPI